MPGSKAPTSIYNHIHDSFLDVPYLAPVLRPKHMQTHGKHYLLHFHLRKCPPTFTFSNNKHRSK